MNSDRRQKLGAGLTGMVSPIHSDFGIWANKFNDNIVLKGRSRPIFQVSCDPIH